MSGAGALAAPGAQIGRRPYGGRQRALRWCLLGIMLAGVAAANACLLLLGGSTEAATRGPFYYGDRHTQLRVDLMPATVGANRFTVAMHTADGGPLDGAHVRLVLEMPGMAALGMPMAPVTLWAEPAGAGRYVVRGLLAMGGRWVATVVVTGTGLPGGRLRATFPITIGS